MVRGGNLVGGDTYHPVLCGRLPWNTKSENLEIQSNSFCSPPPSRGGGWGGARIEHTITAWDVVAGYFKQNEPERKTSAGLNPPCGEPSGGHKHALNPYFDSLRSSGVSPLLFSWGEGEGGGGGEPESPSDTSQEAIWIWRVMTRKLSLLRTWEQLSGRVVTEARGRRPWWRVWCA